MICPNCFAQTFDGKKCTSCRYIVKGERSVEDLRQFFLLKNRYVIGHSIGAGGFGITYIGRDLTLQRRVAIKEYFPVASALRDTTVSLDVTNRYTSQNEAFNKGMERFLAEARTMARMDKQHAIVSVRDFFQENNTAYIVMEYVEGITLKELAESRGGKVSSKELLPMLEPLFEALEALHDAGLVHRDISPDNIMLENGRARLIDFGCARQGSSGSETMTVILKYDYAPIEQYNNRKGEAFKLGVEQQIDYSQGYDEDQDEGARCTLGALKLATVLHVVSFREHNLAADSLLYIFYHTSVRVIFHHIGSRNTCGLFDRSGRKNIC